MVCNLNIDEKVYIIRRDLQQTSRVLHDIRSRYSHTSNQFKLESTNECVTLQILQPQRSCNTFLADSNTQATNSNLNQQTTV